MTEKNYNRRYAKEYNLFQSLFYLSFLHTVVDFVFNFMYDYKIYGKENIPKGSSHYIYCANHVSQFDPPLVTFVTRKKIAYMAKSELFEQGEKLEWLVKNLGAFSVNREKPEIATFKTIKDIFTTDWALGVFPQGGTFPYGQLNNVKKGFASIARISKADIIPIAIAEFSGYPKVWQFKKQKFRVYIGKPISYKLPEEQIVYEWAKFISEHADYENHIPNPSQA